MTTVAVDPFAKLSHLYCNYEQKFRSNLNSKHTVANIITFKGGNKSRIAIVFLNNTVAMENVTEISVALNRDSFKDLSPYDIVS